MSRLRSILSLILVLVTSLLVSCSSPQVSKIPTTYSVEKIEQLQRFVEPITEAYKKMPVLQGYIAEKNWVDARSLIQGPLGQIRQNMAQLSRDLLPKDQKQANQLTKEIFGHFERLDVALKDRNTSLAQSQFRDLLSDFDAFLDFLPKAS